jgi:multiple sugar transport system substrate-binding protein
LISCDARTPGGEEFVTIRFWTPFSGPDGRTMLKLVKQFNQENPDVQVIMQRMHWGTYYNKVFVAGIGGRAPDVFISHRWALQRFVGAGFVRPGDDMLGTSAGQIDPNDFDTNILAAVRLGEHHWGVPLDVHPLGMYYNRTLLKSVGFVDEKGEARPPTNREEFLDVMRRIKQKYTGTSPKIWGYVFTWQRTNAWTFIRQFNGRFFDENQEHATFDDPHNVAAMEWATGLIKDGFAPGPEDFDAWIGFRQGRVAIAFEGIYMMPDLARQKDLDWGAAPLPQLGEQRAAWADSHLLVMRKDIEGNHLSAARRFVKYLSDHSLDWAEGGQVPVRKSLRDSDRFRGMYAQSEFAKQIPYVAYLPPAPFVLEYLQEFDEAVELSLRQMKAPRQALEAADHDVEEVMERYRQQGWWKREFSIAPYSQFAHLGTDARNTKNGKMSDF